MFASLLLLGAAQLSIPLGRPRQIEQPRAPIETAGPRWARACAGSDDWEKAAPPVRIHGNSYFVGTCGISSILITGPSGHVLIDGGPEGAADLIADNIRALGFRVEDVRIILNSHEHFDHAGGIAKLQRLSRAQLISSAPAARVLATGVAGSGDPQAGMHAPFPGADVGRVIVDGEQVRLGDIMIQAIATPGHTPGAMSWRWVSCDGGVCRTIVYADSLSPIGRDRYRFTDHPEVVARFRGSIAKIGASECDILLTPHPASSALDRRFADGKPLFDPDGCKAYAAKLGTALDERLAKEAATR